MMVILLICLSGRIGSGSNAAIAAAASQAIAATQQVQSLTTKIPSSIFTNLANYLLSVKQRICHMLHMNFHQLQVIMSGLEKLLIRTFLFKKKL